MHVADRNGKFAIISASGVEVAEAGQPLISTNFDICGGEDGGSCWRYPVAEEKLAEREVGYATMLSIALDTRQQQYTTLYSNIQNLTTGDVTFLSYHDPDRIAQVNIAELLARGRQTYSFRDLGSLEDGGARSDRERGTVGGVPLAAASVAGDYHSDYIGKVAVAPLSEGIAVTFANGSTDTLAARPNGAYVLEGDELAVGFTPAEADGAPVLNLYLEG